MSAGRFSRALVPTAMGVAFALTVTNGQNRRTKSAQAAAHLSPSGRIDMTYLQGWFEKHASLRESRGNEELRVMGKDDFFKAICPREGLDPSSLPDSVKRKTEKIFKEADFSGGGTVDFREFVLFMTLLNSPIDNFHLAFSLLDKDGNGQLDRSEMGLLLEMVVRESCKEMKTAANKEEAKQFLETITGSPFFQRLFGDTGDRAAGFSEFAAEVQGLMDLLLRMQFLVLCALEGTASVDREALSPIGFLSYIRENGHRRLMRGARGKGGEGERQKEREKQLVAGLDCICFEDFRLFSKLCERVHELETVLVMSTHDKKKIDLATFEKLCAVVGAPLKGAPLQILFKSIDRDNSGLIDPHELMDYLESAGVNKDNVADIKGGETRWEEFRQCLNRVW
uniref:EF-hand domain-containing protein n=1 Tax=Chromera velia CCMP2878 TaxID=1169474 RepID=A0A0G4IBB8_9ALVE|eukprot:Cvel_12776.t1-p1 / transcript=Cvel_12776.t1 / gene=Cvel_12776 / organism=Chromera_velia_CCMP2878 / gene_product=Calcium uptake protein 2, mitochondrial, putative / transcript_product=Calcium uptake protein 2, mitochondrial, putative / location=Cvel_scaffold850:24210-29151(+) / protein_length=395 / sequence_SO=supercontig / SO=protein_coding / is_pseudo=false